MAQIIVSVGKKHDPAIVAAVDEFTDRLSREVATSWHIIKPSGADELTARRVESVAVRGFIQDGDFVVLLDERGREMTSQALAEHYDGWLQRYSRIVFVIGGAYGVDDQLRKRADYIWSLSQLVFPHQIVRLLLVEQLYRARMITKGHPYHHS